VPDELRADVDRQAVVDKVGREQTPEVVWGEPDTGERGVRRGDLFAFVDGG
jgi:hypothetical protein